MEANPAKVIIADDAALIRARLVARLHPKPALHIVEETADVPATIAAVQTHTPDILILDLKMPGGTGLDVLHHVRPTHPQLHIIMLTNHANTFYRKACLKAGANYFFDKSADFDLVETVLDDLTTLMV